MKKKLYIQKSKQNQWGCTSSSNRQYFVSKWIDGVNDSIIDSFIKTVTYWCNSVTCRKKIPLLMHRLINLYAMSNHRPAEKSQCCWKSSSFSLYRRQTYKELQIDDIVSFKHENIRILPAFDKILWTKMEAVRVTFSLDILMNV